VGTELNNSLEEKQLIKKCLRNDRRAQRELYDRFGPLMKAVCIRYLFDSSICEEVMNRGFYKVFKNLNRFRFEGSFEGWIRKIMVRECLNENEKTKKARLSTDLDEAKFLKQAPEAQDNHSVDFIMKVIKALPEGYRLVFNLYEIEGYNHSEIAEQLNITESASRSQLTRAKQLLRKKLKGLQGL